jgi:hypothetical protein
MFNEIRDRNVSLVENNYLKNYCQLEPNVFEWDLELKEIGIEYPFIEIILKHVDSRS